MTRYPVIALLLSSTLLVNACVPVGIATGAAAATGIKAGQEGGLKSAVSDTGIRARINDYWFKYDTEMFRKVDMTIDQGRVLLTGVVQKPEHRVEAVRLAWQAKGVKQVINEIQVGSSQSIGGYTKDRWISGQIKTEMVLNKNIQSINYSIDTVKGVVYLMGVAQSTKELDKVVNIARKTKGVKQVVSYVKMAGEPIVAEPKGSTTGPGQTLTPITDSTSSSSTSYEPAPMSSEPLPAYSPPVVPSKSDIQSEQLPP